MLKQEYQWILATVAMMRRATDLDENEPWPVRPLSIEIDQIEGVSGRLRPSERRAANDPEARLFVFLVIWWLICAKYRANLINTEPISRKLTRVRFFPAPVVKPAPILNGRVFSTWFALCHFDHLPTGSSHNAVQPAS